MISHCNQSSVLGVD